MEIWHITPVNDIEEHEESIDCHCNPTINNEENAQIVVHNAFDGRELYEVDSLSKN